MSTADVTAIAASVTAIAAVSSIAAVTAAAIRLLLPAAMDCYC